MDHFEKQAGVSVEATDQDFDYWLNQSHVGATLRSELSQANILLVPNFLSAEGKKLVFPEHTESLFQYLKDNASSGANVDICIEDEDYVERALHSDLISLATFVVTSVLIPVLVNLLSDYIKKVYGRQAEKSDVEVTLIEVKPDGNARKLSYKGKAADLKKTIDGLRGGTNASGH